MRTLVVTNFYPPHHIGGYELGCRDVVDGLRARGQTVEVLTSRHGVRRPGFSDGAWRVLRHNFQPPTAGSPAQYVLRLLRKEMGNLRAFRERVHALRPDIVYFWNLWTISVGLVRAAHLRAIPTAHYASDLSLHNWQGDEWVSFIRQAGPVGARSMPRRLVRLLAPGLGLMRASDAVDLQTVHFASAFLAREMAATGQPVGTARVIHWGVPVADGVGVDDALGRVPARWLYAGRLSPEKGVHTAIEALRIVHDRWPSLPATLTIAGPTTATGYDAELRALVARLGLDGHVRWAGAVPRARLASVYRSHDVFVFPSLWQEPFSIALLEAMAAGMAVVTTLTGGTGEIAIAGDNALVFAAGDAQSCAEQIARLYTDAPLRQGMRARAHETIASRFSLDRMIDEIDDDLRRAVSSPSRV